MSLDITHQKSPTGWQGTLLLDGKSVRVTKPVNVLFREVGPGIWTATAFDGVFEASGRTANEALEAVHWFMESEYQDYASAPADKLGKLAKKKLEFLSAHFSPATEDGCLPR